MLKNWIVFAFIFLLLHISAAHPAKIVNGVVSNIVSALVKCLWSLKSNTKTDTAVSSSSMMKFEDGYTVETVFDGSKLGTEPYSVELSPSGELLVLDSENSNIYKIPTPLSRYRRPKLIAGSSEGYTGHVDRRLREARMNHPKGLTVYDQGNIYIADTMNMAIRKISDGGITTIAGGKWVDGDDHVDGPSEDAKFSNDFDVVYIGSSCSLFVIDRGNQAIREIQLHDEDCSYQYDDSFHLGVAVLAAAAFFGYMVALLQRRVQALFSSNYDSTAYIKKVALNAPYQGPPKSVSPLSVTNECEGEKPDGGVFGSIGRLVFNSNTSTSNISNIQMHGQ
uniref:SMP-30/Gluconolactonase/LRE-like region domain-containing protein n=1 Tax=Manihot esculenta TaxID=3983 RepID=A0A199UBB8_MANES